ncbi:polysaccharide deacetylase family protein [Streptomyces sp. NPDC020719]|uniref:polysaccharide deacetylase family protein n=1 Tax=unclassified Streptomyces TaxID=2593676 RepID=UPI0033DAAA9D
MTRAHRRLAGLLVAGALAVSLFSMAGCAQSVDPIGRLGRKAAAKVAPRTGGREAAARRWGLAGPLPPAPAPPARRLALPFVVDRVPLPDRQKVVFVTYDGAVRDPALQRMVRELKLPVSTFAAPSGHATDLRALPYEGQRAEICGRGVRPQLFRPPSGAYNADTLRAARACGVRSLVLWRASMSARGDALRYRSGARLRPGDIVLARCTGPGTPAARAARMLRRIQEQGFTVGRLEDYM